MKTAFIVTAAFLIIAAGIWFISNIYRQTGSVPMVKETSTPSPAADQKPELVRVSEPMAGSLVSSPLTVRGQARGNWFFEASFPVRLVDATGVEVAKAIATAQGEWMTEQFVPFTATLTFSAKPSTDTGTLILEKDNPSGLPENADQLIIPVKFK